MKKITLSLALLFSAVTGYSQNLILNGNFESFSGTPQGGAFTGVQPAALTSAIGWTNGCAIVPNGGGAIGHAFIYSDHPNTALAYQIPMAGEIGARVVANTTNRGFAGISGYKDLVGQGASITGSITEPLSDQYIYKISLWYALGYIPSTPIPYQTKLEVILRKEGNCQDGKSVFLSPNLARLNEYAAAGNPKTVSYNWTNLNGEFALTAAEAASNYTKIEIRFNGHTLYMGGIDDVELTKRQRPKAEFSFVTIGQTYTYVSTPYGPEELTQVCASPSPAITPVLINGGASAYENGYGIQITPINTTTYAIGTSIYNAWIAGTGQVPTTDININNLPGMTTRMQVGQTYLVSLFVGDANFQHRKSRLFRINPLPTINAGADATICSADGVTVTTSNWPVQVTKGGVTVGNYYSNPIMLPAAANATYTFRTTNSFGCGALDDAVLTMKACSRASFVFKNPITSETVSSPYGPTTVSHLCAPYKIDGSASVNENGYHIRIQRFDIANYSFMDTPLFNDWVGTGGQQAGNDINLSAIVSSVQKYFTIGHIYLVGLSVGPDWHSDTKFFKAVACAKNGESALEEGLALEDLDLLVYPNPNDGKFAVSFKEQLVQYLEVTDLTGKSVFVTDVPSEATAVNIDLSDLANGVYMVNVRQMNGETIVQKIIKN